jgi:hypothetical protein
MYQALFGELNFKLVAMKNQTNILISLWIPFFNIKAELID